MTPAGAGPAGEASRPRRTCVGCRTTTTDDELLRLALSRPSAGAGAGPAAADAVAVVVPDPRRRLGGRGAWLHPDPACLALAVRRRAVPRALRVPAPVDLSAVEVLLAPRDDAG